MDSCWKRISALAGLLAIALGLTVGCAASTDAPSSGPLKITMMVPYWLPEPGKNDSEPMKIIQQYTNSQLNVTWIPNSAYDDKLSASIAGQDLPQIVFLSSNANNKGFIVNAIRAGMFWDIGPYLQAYPNLSHLDSSLVQGSLIDGKQYGIPVSRPQARGGIIIRQDWLDRLSLPQPKTLDELIHTVSAFALNDPDHNGKKDTFGFSETTGLGSFNTWLAYFGGPNGWGIQNGKLTPDFMTNEYLDVMKLYKGFYDQNIINQDFLVVKDNTDAINKGKAGLVFAALDSVERKYNPLLNSDPNAKLDVISRIQGPKGVRVQTQGVLPEQFVFPKTAVKTEQQLKQLLTFMDKLGGPKIQNLFAWGIEGEHYKIENGKAVRTDAKKYSDDLAAFSQSLTYDFDSKAMPGDKPPLVAKAAQMQKENQAVAVTNPVQTLISDTQIEKGDQLGKSITDARAKFIMGQIDENGWNQAIAGWRSQGGDKIIQEYTTAYDKSTKM